ncbi:MAG: hypothetical protein J5I81_00375 [Nitrococcus mobilis]|nr:hypothetical protein [Nitrococcus mobilis]
MTRYVDALAPIAHGANRLLLSSWLGGDSVEAARDAFSAAGLRLPMYETPED